MHHHHHHNNNKSHFLPLFLCATDVTVALCKTISKCWTSSLGWQGTELCSSWVSVAKGTGGENGGVWCLLSSQGMDSPCGCQGVTCPQRAPVTHELRGLEDRGSISSTRSAGHLSFVPLWGTSGRDLGLLREGFHLSCQAEEIWLEPWSQCRLRCSSLGWPHLLGRKETGVQQGWWI